MIPIPKIDPTTLNTGATLLRKLGKASVTVTRVAHADDSNFSTRPPHCHVTVTATDPADKKFLHTDGCDLFGKELPENRNSFLIPVNTGLKKLWGKGRTLRVHIAADPTEGFQNSHEPWTSDPRQHPELERVVAGNDIKVNVSLKPKSAGGEQTIRRDSPESIEVSTDNYKK